MRICLIKGFNDNQAEQSLEKNRLPSSPPATINVLLKCWRVAVFFALKTMWRHWGNTALWWCLRDQWRATWCWLLIWPANAEQQASSFDWLSVFFSLSLFSFVWNASNTDEKCFESRRVDLSLVLSVSLLPNQSSCLSHDWPTVNASEQTVLWQCAVVVRLKKSTMH